MLTVIYLALLVIGLLVVGVGLWSLHRLPSPEAWADADAYARLMRLVPITVGISTAVFGLLGLVLLALTDAEPGATVIWALGASLLVGFVVQAILYFRVLRG